jgi:hypothetical protein
MNNTTPSLLVKLLESDPKSIGPLTDSLLDKLLEGDPKAIDLLADNLLVRLLEGDPKAMGPLYAIYAEPFYNTAKQSGLSDADADKAVDTWLDKVLHAVLDAESDAKYDPEKGHAKPWLRSVFRNVVRDIRRCKTPGELTNDLIENDLSDPVDGIDNPPVYTLYKEVQEYILHAFQQLSKPDRLRILRELLHKEGRLCKEDRQLFERILQEPLSENIRHLLLQESGKRGPVSAARAHWHTKYHQIYQEQELARSSFIRRTGGG